VKLLSFAVWGNDPKYLLGATKNAVLAHDIYPGWKCRFYVSQEVPYPWIYNLKKINNTEVIQVPKIGDWTFSFNRFLAMSEENIEVMVSRDADSRLCMREKYAVDEWLNSDKGFHIMKDHPWHYTYPILAGMFGCKSRVIKDNISNQIDSFSKSNWYHSDQEFLKHIIYPEIARQCANS
jgi:protein O-GlcNAc transferase